MRQQVHHDTLGPSTLPAIMDCACYVSRGYSDKDAGLGSRMHEYTESFFDQSVVLNGELDRQDREDCDAVVEELRHFFRENAPDATVLAEQRVEIHDNQLNVQSFGTGDLLADVPDAAIGVDLKGGLDFRPWAHDYRAQVKGYALGTMQQKGVGRAIWAIAYLRPRKIFVYQLTYDECEASFWAAKRRREDPNRQPQPCSSCKYCGNLTRCAAVLPGLAIVEDSHKPPQIPASLLEPEQITDGQEMSQTAIFVDDVVKAWIKRLEEVRDRVKDTAIAMLQGGTQIPYYELGQKRGQQRVTDVDGAWTILKEQIEASTWYSGLKISVPSMARAYAEECDARGEDMTIKGARAFLDGLLDPLLVSEPPTPELKRLRERRRTL